MILRSNEIAEKLCNISNYDDPLIINPMPDIENMKSNPSASVDLRLGTWFLSFKQSNSSCLDITEANSDLKDYQFTREHYLPFGKSFTLHPRSFVLGTTLEWIRIPETLAGYVVGKSSWGRRGLIIATATGVHPKFSGCLTLEITNLGEIPIKIYPGMLFCQLFLHSTTDVQRAYQSKFAGRRKPSVGKIQLDEVTVKLIQNI